MTDQNLMTRRSVAAGVERRAATATTYDAEARTVEMVLATETPILMPGWRIGIEQRTYYEILDCSPEAVDLSQVEAGNAPLLDSHGRWSLADRLGVLNSARLEGGQLIVVAGFGESEAARTLEAEVAAGTAPPASAGYAIQQLVLERFEGDIQSIARLAGRCARAPSPRLPPIRTQGFGRSTVPTPASSWRPAP